MASPTERIEFAAKLDFLSIPSRSSNILSIFLKLISLPIIAGPILSSIF